jgi:putative ABC transport system permease protein
MFYALATLRHELNRFVPGILAVAFSTLLVTMQCGVLLGLLSLTSLPVDQTSADVWVGHPVVLSVDLGRPIPERWHARVAREPEVLRTESFLLAFLVLDKPDGRSELCTIVGSRLDDDALGAARPLTPELRSLLSEPGAIAVDESDLKRLGLKGVGDRAEVLGKRVRLVGTVTGMKSLAAPFVFCSLQTARTLLIGVPREQTVYILARTRSKADAEAVVKRLKHYEAMSVFTSDDFSNRTRLYWLTATKSGLAVGWSAILGLLVGVAVTSQTLYAATAASLREYAVLSALGVPRWRMSLAVLGQAVWVGGLGVVVALPMIAGLTILIEAIGGKVLIPLWLLGGATALTMAMATGSGLMALRSLRRIEPTALLR